MRTFLRLSSVLAACTLTALGNQTAQAASVKFKSGPVAGSFVALGEVQIDEAEALLSCHFCTVATCAGGPTKTKELVTKLGTVSLLDGGAKYPFTAQAGGGKFRSGGWFFGLDLGGFRYLRSCSYLLALKGIDKTTAKVVKGDLHLAFSLSERVGGPAIGIWKDPQFAEKLSQALQANPPRILVEYQSWSPTQGTLVLDKSQQDSWPLVWK